MSEGSNGRKLMLLTKGYFFLARNLFAGKIVDKVLDLLAWSDYRLLILISMWHPNLESRKRLLRKRGVQVGEHCWIDQGVRIEVTTPQAVVIEDYAGIAYGAEIHSHDAGVNNIVDMPMRVKPTILKHNCIIGSHSIIMPGVTVGANAGVTAGSVVTVDVPDGAVVAGNPARQIMIVEQVIEKWHEDMKVNPDYYFDHPNPFRAPSTPFDHLLTWREEGLVKHSDQELRTGTPFDYILDAKQAKQDE